MAPRWTPQQTIELMLQKKRLSARLALAIAHLDRRWMELPYGVRLEESYDPELKRKRKALRDLLQSEPLDTSPLRCDKINARSEAWLRRAANASLLDLLAWVVEVDLALLPDLAVPGRLKVLRSKHALPPELGDDIWIFEGPPALFTELHGELEERRKKAGGKKLTSSRLYGLHLADWLSCVRYSRDRIECTDTSPFLEARVNEIWGEGSRKASGLEIRIGLFSLRGSFSTSFQYTRQLAHQKHGFRALGIGPAEAAEEYLARLDRVIEEASHPARGVHILLLPELIVDRTGRERLSAQLAAMACRSDRKPPLLTVAGSFHFQRDGNETTWSNVCTVLDHTGRVLWDQPKRVPFPFPGSASSWLQGCPDGLGSDESYHEDIEPGTCTVLARSPLGWLSIAICSDLVPFSTGAASAMAALPVDWVLIPSMSTTTEQFLEVARELTRTGKVVCFANVAPKPKGGEAKKRPPAFLDQNIWRSDLAAFVQTPVGYAFGLWFDDPDAPAPTGNARIAIPECGTWEGLVVDLLGVVDAYLTR